MEENTSKILEETSIPKTNEPEVTIQKPEHQKEHSHSQPLGQIKPKQIIKEVPRHDIKEKQQENE